VLLERSRGGDREARERLFARYVPILTRWAHQRLPRAARDLTDTPDLVQVTLMRAFARLDAFEPRGEGAFLGYLRQILMNAVRDEVRRVARRGVAAPLAEEPPDPGPSALETMLGRDALERYERGLARLSKEQREAVILRIEMGFDHAQIAEALGKPSANAARMFVARSLAALAEEMHE
jgi:RNA polymerase sigma-70 factor (ECF subfamily)